MTTAEIITMVLTIVFALPPFIKMIVDCIQNYKQQKKLFIFELKDEDPVLSGIILTFSITNITKNNISIIDFFINNTRTLLLKNKHYEHPGGFMIASHDTKVVKMLAPHLDYNDKLEIKVETSNGDYYKMFETVKKELSKIKKVK